VTGSQRNNSLAVICFLARENDESAAVKRLIFHRKISQLDGMTNGRISVNTQIATAIGGFIDGVFIRLFVWSPWEIKRLTAGCALRKVAYRYAEWKSKDDETGKSR